MGPEKLRCQTLKRPSIYKYTYILGWYVICYMRHEVTGTVPLCSRSLCGLDVPLVVIGAVRLVRAIWEGLMGEPERPLEHDIHLFHQSCQDYQCYHGKQRHDCSYI